MWDKRKAGVLATLAKGQQSGASILADNTTLLPSAAIARETIVQLRDDGDIVKIAISKYKFEYRLSDKFSYPAPVSVPDHVPQMNVFDIVRGMP